MAFESVSGDNQPILDIKIEEDSSELPGGEDQGEYGLVIKTEEVEIFSELPDLEPDFYCNESQQPIKEEVDIFAEIPDVKYDLYSEESQQSTKDTLGPGSRKQFRCYICDTYVVMQNMKWLLWHLVAFHKKSGTYECSECNRSLPDVVTLNKHLEEHEATKQFRCTMCPVKFSTDFRRKMHQKTKHIPKYCRFNCGKKFNEIRLKAHERSRNCIRLGNITHKCYLCLNVFDIRYDLHKHLITTHALLGKYHCDECNYTVNKIITYNEHLSHHDADGRPFTCSVCPFRFKNALLLMRHEVDVHNLSHESQSFVEKEKKFSCSACPLKFYYEYRLKDHVLRVHKNPTNGNVGNETQSRNHLNKKTYSCSRCDEKFQNVSILRQHELLIHGLQPNSGNPAKEAQILDSICTICNKTLPHPSFRRQHERFEHNITTLKHEYNLRQCYLCDGRKVLPCRRALEDHLREIHPRLSEYECRMCSYTTKSKPAFNQHQSQHYSSKTQS